MRSPRQVVWLLVAGALWSSGVVTTRRAGLQTSRPRDAQRFHASPATPLQIVAAVAVDDDDPSDAPGPGRGPLRLEPRAPHHPVEASRAPVADRNPPVLARRKLPSPGDDVPPH